jgi:hypothetical protein
MTPRTSSSNLDLLSERNSFRFSRSSLGFCARGVSRKSTTFSFPVFRVFARDFFERRLLMLFFSSLLWCFEERTRRRRNKLRAQNEKKIGSTKVQRKEKKKTSKRCAVFCVFFTGA